ncbi:hypothetical protein [Actinomadura rubrisoli]|nr:hypothetical protein [Actinomadura rubrisoli]
MLEAAATTLVAEAAMREADRREIAAHPDLAELDQHLDGFYEEPT